MQSVGQQREKCLAVGLVVQRLAAVTDSGTEMFKLRGYIVKALRPEEPAIGEVTAPFEPQKVEEILVGLVRCKV